MAKKQVTIGPLSAVDEERFWSKVQKNDPRGCWLWLGAKVGPGYGKVKLNGRSCYAHRVAYALLRDKSPDVYIANRCGNLACVNPEHLAAQSREERGQSARKQAQVKRRTDFRQRMGLHPDFPLFPLGDSNKPERQRWAKKAKGRLHYFGRVSDDLKGEKALAMWIEQKDDLLAGRMPRVKVDGVKLADICNNFLSAKRRAVDSGQLSPRTFVEYDRTCQLLISAFGRDRLAEDLGPTDFSKLYGRLVKSFGMTTIGREVIKVRTLFNFAAESDLIQKAIKYGPEFVAPTKKAKRKHKAELKQVHGAKTFTADEIQCMLEAAGPQLKAMIMLGINCGFGNTDCASLPLSALDLKKGWLDHPRPKTGIDRRVPLWPETLKALKAVIAKRQLSRSSEHANLVFLTRLGQPWVRYELAETKEDDGKVRVTGKADDAIAKATTKLLTNLGIKRPGLSFYALRHTFETEAGASRDQVAVDAIMGHIDGSMVAEYRERIDDDRLQNVVQHVHRWLFAKTKQAKGKGVQHAK